MLRNVSQFFANLMLEEFRVFAFFGTKNLFSEFGRAKTRKCHQRLSIFDVVAIESVNRVLAQKLNSSTIIEPLT